MSELATEDGLVAELYNVGAERLDSGLFQCKAINAYGSATLNVHVLVEEVPDPPTHFQASEIDSRVVTLKWSMPFTGNSPITKYSVEWKRDKGL